MHKSSFTALGLKRGIQREKCVNARPDPNDFLPINKLLISLKINSSVNVRGILLFLNSLIQIMEITLLSLIIKVDIVKSI